MGVGDLVQEGGALTKKQVRALEPGLYILDWKDGGRSQAAVGVTKDGGRWLAPVNWVSATDDQRYWKLVKSATRLD